MSRLKTIGIPLLVLAAAFLLVTRVLNLLPSYNAEEGCPASKCTLPGEGVSPSSTEAGRIAVSHFPNIPPMMQGMPLDSSPIRVLESYQEVTEGDASEGESKHTQSTYIYSTAKDGKTAALAFENYLKKEGFAVTSTSEGLLHTVFGKLDGTIANITIAGQNQFEGLVTVSLVSAEKIP